MDKMVRLGLAQCWDFDILYIDQLYYLLTSELILLQINKNVPGEFTFYSCPHFLFRLLQCLHYSLYIRLSFFLLHV